VKKLAFGFACIVCILAIACSDSDPKKQTRKDPDVDLGILNYSNEFLIEDEMTAWDDVTLRDLYKKYFTNSAYTIRRKIKKTDAVSVFDSLKMECYTTEYKTEIDSPADTIVFYKNGSSDTEYYYMSRKRDIENNEFIGGPVFLVLEGCYKNIKAQLPDEMYGIRVLSLPSSLDAYFNVKVVETEW
jgi:hypothetical protein